MKIVREFTDFAEMAQFLCCSKSVGAMRTASSSKTEGLRCIFEHEAAGRFSDEKILLRMWIWFPAASKLSHTPFEVVGCVL